MQYKGIKVLCDPWLTEGIYYGSWYHYPPLEVGPEDFHDVNYIYLTHIHPDHCDIESLKRFPKSTPILIHDYEEKFLLRLIRSLGFQQIIEMPHKQPFALSPEFGLESLAADNCNPNICGRWLGCHVASHPSKTLQIDSMAVFYTPERIAVNTNDCPYQLAKGVCEYIIQKYKKVDFLLTGYMGAGPYPQCFSRLNHEEKIAKAKIKEIQFINQAVSYINDLKPRYFMPFAGQYTLGGSLADLNPYRGLPELQDLDDLFEPHLKKQNLSSELLLLNPRESFDLTHYKASAPFTPINLTERQQFVNNVLRKQKFTYETLPNTLNTLEEFFPKLHIAHQHMQRKMHEFGFSSNTHLYLDIGHNEIFQIPFTDQPMQIIPKEKIIIPYVCISLHPGLLQMILERKAHWNNAEIGSHLLFDRLPDTFERGIYYFLSYLN